MIYIRKIIDNEPRKYQLDKYTMANALQEIIEQKKPDMVDIAVGFFNLSGWRLLENHLHQLKSSRFLIGWEVSNLKNIEREIQEWFTHKLEDIPLDEYAQTLSYVKSLIVFLEKKNPKWTSYSDKIKEEHPEWEYANQFRLYARPHIHGKLYLFPHIGILGSSNFTGGGFTGNTELNMAIDDKDLLIHLKGWFEHFFNSSRSIDYRPILLKQLRDSKFGDKEYEPYWVFLKIVFELQKQEIRRNLEDEEEVVRLAEFQQEGVARALDIIDDFGGVMIADAVGLGKSYMGVSILRTLAIRAPPMKNNILVVCPAQLKDNWEEHLINGGLTSATIFTQEMMSRNPIEKKAYDIILVDESHNFRKPKPKRYSNFMNLLTRKEPKVILLTATPINTTELDLYYQLKLIFKNKDTALSDSLNIPNLHDYFKTVVNGINDLSLITEHLLVARSRSVIRYRQKVLKQDILLPNGKKIEFPDRILDTIKYQILKDKKILEDLGEKYFSEEFKKIEKKYLEQDKTQIIITPSNLIYEWIFKILNKWKGAAYKIEAYKKPNLQNDDKLKGFRSIIPLMSTTLLKRLESSLFSFIKSVQNQIQFCKFSRYALKNGYIISSRALDELKSIISNEEDDPGIDVDIFDTFEKIDDILNETLDSEGFKQKLRELEVKLNLSTDNRKNSMIEKLNMTEFEESSVAKLLDDIEKDEILFQGIFDISSKIIDVNDFKLEALKEKIKEIFKEAKNYQEKKVIIFSFFETTAKYIFDQFNQDIQFKEDLKFKIDIISGKVTSRNKRKEIINKFAPISSEVEIPITDQLDILISTDVLSEGQNLQDAKHVINYDLHWNPVRMIQRAGRIDRLGSIHKEIVIHNFFLEDGLEALLNLMQRIVIRLRKIDDTIELDAPVIEMEGEYLNLNRIEDQDSTIIEEYEAKLEFVGLNQSKKDLLTAIQEIGYEKFAKTPMGIHSGMLTPDNSGLMVSVKIKKKNMKTPSIFWVYEPDDAEKEFPKLNLQNGIIKSKHIIEKIIRCGKATPRVVIEKPEDIYSRAAKIVKKLEDYQRQKETASIMITTIEAGNKKYYTITRKAIKHWGLDNKYAKRFIEFLKEKKFDNIRRDPAVLKPLDKFNLEFENIDKAAKHLEDDSGLDKWRKETIEEFLYNIYEYFDSHEILTEKEIRKRSKEKVKVTLIGIIRVYTTDTLNKNI